MSIVQISCAEQVINQDDADKQYGRLFADDNVNMIDQWSK